MPQTVSFTELTELVTNVLIHHGVSLENAGPVADSTVACEPDGTASRRLLRLPGKDFDIIAHNRGRTCFQSQQEPLGPFCTAKSWRNESLRVYPSASGGRKYGTPGASFVLEQMTNTTRQDFLISVPV